MLFRYAFTPLFILLLLLSSAQFAIAEQDEALRRVLRATVQIVIRDTVGAVVGTGSGAIVSPQGYILTAKHVLQDYYKAPESTKVFVRMLDSNLSLGSERRAEVISRDLLSGQ